MVYFTPYAYYTESHTGTNGMSTYLVLPLNPSIEYDTVYFVTTKVYSVTTSKDWSWIKFTFLVKTTDGIIGSTRLLSWVFFWHSLSCWCSYTPPSTCYSLGAITRAAHSMFYVQCLLYCSESRKIMYTFIYSNLHSHGYEDLTIHHQRTSKNTITLLNFPYIHSHTQSHSPRAPPWPSPPAFCGLDLAVNQYVIASRA